MRAIFINSDRQVLEEIDIPAEVGAFNQRIRTLLQTDEVNIVQSNELLTVIMDGEAAAKETNAFWSGLMEDWPLYGNVICVGRNPNTREMEDLYEEYGFESFAVSWCDKQTTEHYRKIVLEFAKRNFT